MEGKKDDDTIKEIEEHDEPKPRVVPSVAQTESSKPSIIKSAAPSQDASRTKTNNATPDAVRSEETPGQIPVESSAKVSEAPTPAKISEPPTPMKISEPPSAKPSVGQHPSVQTSEIPGPHETPLSKLSEAPPPSIQASEVPPSGQIPDLPIPSAGQLSDVSRRSQGHASKTKTMSEASRDKIKTDQELMEDLTSDLTPKKRVPSRPDTPTGIVGCLASGLPSFDNFSCSKFFAKRSPFVHNPPRPEERRPRIERPRSPRDYIINLREDLADFQESHGLPRSRDYSFMSLGLALAQETARAICSVFLMFSELFPVIAIISLVLRFALDKLIDILETHEPVPKLKKTLIFCLQMVMILIPLWILIGTIVLPLAGLLFSIFRKLLRFKGGKSGRSCTPPKRQANPVPKKIDPPKAKTSCGSSSG